MFWYLMCSACFCFLLGLILQTLSWFVAFLGVHLANIVCFCHLIRGISGKHFVFWSPYCGTSCENLCSCNLKGALSVFVTFFGVHLANTFFKICSCYLLWYIFQNLYIFYWFCYPIWGCILQTLYVFFTLLGCIL